LKPLNYILRLLLLTAILFAEKRSTAQLNEGLNKQEALDMIALCNSYTFLELYNSDAEIIPKGYKKTYTSGVFGMDNRFQIYEKGMVAVINIRGSTDKQISWLENIYSAMIPAVGKIEIEGQTFDYKFAKDSTAAVHSGFALGLAYLHSDLISRIQILNNKGIYDIILTGHSQGGALVNLLRAYLNYVSPEVISPKNRYKVYSFASPMLGNKAFIQEYNAMYVDKNAAFSFINSSDPIPELPVSYNDSNFLKDNIKALLFDRESFSVKKIVSDGSILLLENKIGKYVKRFGNSTSNKISKDLGHVVMPGYVDDFNYMRQKNEIIISKFLYPKILKDSSILENDSLMAIYPRHPNGHFVNEKLYKKASWTFQHKPYNYYVSLMEMYFPLQYAVLKRRYLLENL
jgi:hypothetical protein